MSYTRIGKSYQAIVTMSDETDIAFDIQVDYLDTGKFNVPEIDVEITQQPQDLEGMVAQYDDEIIYALDTWFTKDCAQQEDGADLCFTFDTVMETVELAGDIPEIEDPQPSIDKALEQIKKDITNGDLTAIEELLKLTPLSIVKGYLAED